MTPSSKSPVRIHQCPPSLPCRIGVLNKLRSNFCYPWLTLPSLANYFNFEVITDLVLYFRFPLSYGPFGYFHPIWHNESLFSSVRWSPVDIFTLFGTVGQGVSFSCLTAAAWYFHPIWKGKSTIKSMWPYGHNRKLKLSIQSDNRISNPLCWMLR